MYVVLSCFKINGTLTYLLYDSVLLYKCCWDSSLVEQVAGDEEGGRQPRHRPISPHVQRAEALAMLVYVLNLYHF